MSFRDEGVVILLILGSKLLSLHSNPTHLSQAEISRCPVGSGQVDVLGGDEGFGVAFLKCILNLLSNKNVSAEQLACH